MITKLSHFQDMYGNGNYCMVAYDVHTEKTTPLTSSNKWHILKTSFRQPAKIIMGRIDVKFQ